MNPSIQSYNDSLSAGEKAICDTLVHIIGVNLADAQNKIWHGHPVWFLD